MDNEKETYKINNNNDFADSLDDCKTINNKIDGSRYDKSEKDGMINIEYVDEKPPYKGESVSIYEDNISSENKYKYISAYESRISNQSKFDDKNEKIQCDENKKIQNEFIDKKTYIDESLITQDTDKNTNTNINYEESLISQTDDDGEFVFLRKNENNINGQRESVNLNEKNKLQIKDLIQEEEDKKRESLKEQYKWGRELGEFPVEKKKTEQIEQEETKKFEVDEDIEPIIPPMSPEAVIDIENPKVDIIKPKDFSELVSTKGEILENYISGTSKFNSISQNLSICIELCKLFARIHSVNYCFNSITADDIIITPNMECKLINDKKIVSQDDKGYQVNREKTSAPEIIRNEVRPNINTDKYTMAFLIFGLLFKSDPFEGNKMLSTVYYTKEEELKAYENPIFVYSPEDKSNMPVYGIHSVLIKYWNRFYPESIKLIFKESFVAGVNSPEARIEDNTFIDRLNSFKTIVESKNTKKEPKILVKPENKPNSNIEKIKEKMKHGIDSVKLHKEQGKIFEEKQQNIIEIDKDATKKTSEEPKSNYALRIDSLYAGNKIEDSAFIDLKPGVEIKNSSVGYAEIPGDVVIGKVVQNSKHKGVIGLKNLSKHSWLATKGNKDIKEFLPEKVIVITEGVRIDFYPENKSSSKSRWTIVKRPEY